MFLLPKNQLHSWQCGWEDAHLELLASDRHEQKLVDGESDDYGENWGLLFHAGGDLTCPVFLSHL